MSRLLLAIDQSTSATKAVLVDERGRVTARASRRHVQHYPRPGWVEHDAREIWKNTVAACREVVESTDGAAAAVAAVSIANQRETCLVFDRRSGEPLAPAIVWQCRRGVEVCRELATPELADEVAIKTGLRIDTYFPAPKLVRLLRDEPAIRGAVEDGSAVVATMDAYLVHRLTRGAVFAGDVTNASRTLLFDIHRLEWDEGLCAAFGIPSRSLPEVRGCDAAFGETDLEGVLPGPVPIRGVMGDSQASLLAQRCFAPGDAKVTFGSGSSVLVTIGDSPQPATRGAVTALAWQVAGRPTYAFEGLINYSSATITWMAERLELIGAPEECEALAGSVPDSGGVFLVPAFAGLGAPDWAPDARAAIVGMSGHTTRAHVVRAALESIGFQIRDVAGAMGEAAGAPLVRLAGDGGPTANSFLMQSVADITGLELAVSETPDLSALGAALAGACGLGWFESLDELRDLPLPARSFRPRMARDEADRLHAGWRRAVRQVLAGIDE